MTRDTFRTYSELMAIESFLDRFRYLELCGVVGERTFGSERWMNQRFYRSKEWRDIRNHVIARDNGFDLGCSDQQIPSRPLIHHMNPMKVADLARGGEDILNPEFLITTTLYTHNAIHYGDERLLGTPYVPRQIGDTKLW